MATYTDLDEVKAVLRTWSHLHTGGRRVDFSEHYVNLRPGVENSNPAPSDPIRLYRVDFDDSWEGLVEFTLAFSDTTSFDVTMRPEPNEADIPVGSGTIDASFTAVNPIDLNDIFTLEPSYWTGVATAGDEVLWSSKALYSNDAAEDVLLDAETVIDSWALDHPNRRLQVVNANGLVFPNPIHLSITGPGVPRQIRMACKLIAAFLFWSRVNPTADLRASELFQHWLTAKNLVRQLVNAIPLRGPQVVSRQPIFPISADDTLGSPIFGLAGFKRRGVAVDIADIEERLRTFSLNPKTFNYVSP